ncbi:DUF7674 family protein [Chryseobacterium sp. Mn2064]|uniref:DUF7674 family protein n=1 Tax=Chryseobacterium sp. Mn2064 TaxID=3395263 RepID=UPI003BD8BFF4
MNKAYNIQQIDNVFELLLSSSSYIKESWNDYFDEEYKNNQLRLMYFDMTAIGGFVVKLFQQKKTKDLHLFFDNVELILHDADSEVKNLILTGLIEGIQQICQYENIDIRYEFDNYFHPLTKRNWDEITAFFTFDKKKPPEKFLTAFSVIKK